MRRRKFLDGCIHLSRCALDNDQPPAQRVPWVSASTRDHELASPTVWSCRLVELLALFLGEGDRSQRLRLEIWLGLYHLG